VTKTVHFASGELERCSAWSPNQPVVRCTLPAAHNSIGDPPVHRHHHRFWQVLPTTNGPTTIGNGDSSFTQEGELVGEQNPAEHELRTWWMDIAGAEIDLTVPKAVEYGSTDLIDIGIMLARTMRRTVTEEEAAELGVFFYLIGKIARWQSAIERGERPSDDTLLDIGVYVRMAQRIRHAGGWPGVTSPAHAEGQEQ